jgi:hypothetical protein
LLGEVEVDHAFLMWGSEPGARVWIPTTAYLILGAEAPILVDASFRDAAEFTAASGVPTAAAAAATANITAALDTRLTITIAARRLETVIG